MAVIDVHTFRLADGTDRDEFVALDSRLQTDVAYQQPGIQRRTTAADPDGGWLVLTLWADLDAATTGTAAIEATDPGREWAALTTESTRQRFALLG